MVHKVRNLSKPENAHGACTVGFLDSALPPAQSHGANTVGVLGLLRHVLPKVRLPGGREMAPVFFSTLYRLTAAVLALAAAGCGTPAGVVFPPPAAPVVFPAPPDRARVRFVGQIESDADLKPAVSFARQLSERMFGAREILSLKTPLAVCTDGADRLFVADTTARVVHVFDLKTREYARVTRANGQPFDQPVGLACDPSGRLYVADSSAGVIYVFDSAQKQIAEIGRGQLGRPCGLAFDARQSRLFVADAGRHDVAVFSSAGQFQAVIGSRGTQLGQFNFPTNVALDSKGRLYVSDSLNFRIQQFDPDFHPIRQIGQNGDTPGSFGQPKGIAIDSQDHLYVVDANFEVVQIFDSDGTFLLDFGGEGPAPGQFWLPAGIFIDPRNRIWIADSYNHRVQVLDYLPE